MIKQTNKNNKVSFWVGMLLFSLLLTACAGSSQKTRKPASDWSRGLWLGGEASGSLDTLYSPANEQLSIVWPEADGRIVFTKIDLQNGNPVRQEILISGSHARNLQVLASGADGARFFWIAQDDAHFWRVWTGVLEAQAANLSQEQALSPAEEDVLSYAITADHSGGAWLAWSEKATASLWLAHWNARNELELPILLTEYGHTMALNLDDAGNLHVVWKTKDEGVQYAFFPGGQLTAEFQPVMLRKETQSGGRINVLSMVTTGQQVYVFWSVVNRSGLEGGTAVTEFVTFPIGGATNGSTQRLSISMVEKPTLVPYQAGDQLAVTHLAPPASLGRGSDYVQTPFAIATSSGDVIAAVSAKQPIRLDDQMQMVVAIFANGQFQGYQPAVHTETISQSGQVRVSQDGYLYLVWQEGAASNKVYFATTQPDLRAELDRLTWADAGNGLMQGAMEGIVGMALFPLALIWLIPGIIVLALLAIFPNGSELTSWLARAGVIAALGVYQSVKLAFLPTIISYVPFSAWMEVPESFHVGLRFGVPTVIFGLAILSGLRARHRWELQTALPTYFLIAGIDALLTLAVYGVNLLGSI